MVKAEVPVITPPHQPMRDLFDTARHSLEIFFMYENIIRLHWVGRGAGVGSGRLV